MKDGFELFCEIMRSAEEPKPKEVKAEPKFNVGDRVRVKELKELHELCDTIILRGGYETSRDIFAGRILAVKEILEGTHIGYGLKGTDGFIWDERLLLPPNHCPEPKTITESGATFTFNGPATICIIEAAGRKFKGVAKCAPDDTWNETTGKGWAGIRAIRKVLDATEKELRKA